MTKSSHNAATTTRILLVDDHTILREGLRRCLAVERDFEVVGEAGTGAQALERVASLQPAVVIMDIGLPDGDGIDFARQMHARWPGLKIIILSALADREHLDAGIAAGIAGYVLKVKATEELIGAIRAALRGETHLSLEVSALLLGGYRELLTASRQFDPAALSDREAEVLKRIADGCTTKAIADQLNLSVKTIESHRVRIMAKLNLHSVAELTKHAIRKGLSPL
jgi:two-component system, NarL family, response regulator NreC